MSSQRTLHLGRLGFVAIASMFASACSSSAPMNSLDAGIGDGASAIHDLAAPTSPDGEAGDAAISTAPLPTGFPVLPVPPTPTGHVLTVGAGKTYATPCAALTVAVDGDTIAIDAATYPGDTCHFTANNLTIRGVGNGRAIIDLTGVKPSECKAIWVVGGHDTLIDNVEFMGAHLVASDAWVMDGTCTPDNNGAGLRVEGANLTVESCSFHDNDDGILTDPGATSAILIERSIFFHNSADGFSHNLYIGQIGRLTFQYNYSSRTLGPGHLLKSRAMVNVILYNRLTGEDGADSYEINLPNGGTSYVIGNVIEQGPSTSNGAMLDYASEGFPMGWDTHLFVVNNTFVSTRPGGATFVQLANSPTALLVNNLFAGMGAITNAPASATSTINLTDAAGDPKFTDAAQFDYHVLAGSPLTGAGSNPGMANNLALTPVNEYVYDESARARVIKPMLDVGAFSTP